MERRVAPRLQEPHQFALCLGLGRKVEIERHARTAIGGERDAADDGTVKTGRGQESTDLVVRAPKVHAGDCDTARTRLHAAVSLDLAKGSDVLDLPAAGLSREQVLEEQPDLEGDLLHAR